jgi:hypothetical protein
MSDFWTDLAAKTNNPPDGVRPRLPARFEAPLAVEPGERELVETPQPESQPMRAPPRHTNVPLRHIDTVPPQSDHPGTPAALLSPLRTITEPAAPPPLETPVRQATSSATTAPVSHGETLPEQQGPPVVSPPLPVPQPLPTVVQQTRVQRVIERRRDPQPPAESHNIHPPTPRSPSPVAPPMPASPPLSAGPEPQEMTSTTANEPPGTLLRPKITPLPAQPIIEQVRSDTAAPPSVRVTIGRVEVRAVTPPLAPRPTPRPPARFQPPLTLKAYLQRRNEGV